MNNLETRIINNVEDGLFIRGNILSVYLFRIESKGFDLESLSSAFNSNEINKDEYRYLCDYYNRSLCKSLN